ncbi:MAG: GNAT family N-acetyltransferase [Sphingobacteriaceae bacterium]|nr:GNAT family N-acetyltransferase [Sphingobacteriaceae bacterium]
MNTLKNADFHNSSKKNILSMVNLRRTTANDVNFHNLIKELNNDLRARYNNLSYKFDANITVDNLQTVVLGLINDDAVGCGCFKEIDDSIVEIKRMFVNPYFRGLGVSTSILTELIDWAGELNYTTVVLETGKKQEESISLYKKYGFSLIPNFGPYVGMADSVCMGKTL